MTDYAVEEYDADPYLWYQIIYEYGRHAVTEHIAKIIARAPQSLLSTGSCKTLLDTYERRIESGYKIHDLRYSIERSSTLSSGLTLHRESSIYECPLLLRNSPNFISTFMIWSTIQSTTTWFVVAERS